MVSFQTIIGVALAVVGFEFNRVHKLLTTVYYTKISTFLIFMTFYFFSSLKTRFGFVSYSKDVDFEDFLFFVKHLL